VLEIAADGTVSGGAVLCTLDKGAPDGIRVDATGRVWTSSGDGVQIFGADGKLIGRILLPEAAANLCFGGADGRTLFMTARTSLYAVPTVVTGASRVRTLRRTNFRFANRDTVPSGENRRKRRQLRKRLRVHPPCRLCR